MDTLHMHVCTYLFNSIYSIHIVQCVTLDMSNAVCNLDDNLVKNSQSEWCSEEMF